METLRLFNLSRWALVLVIALDFVIPHAHAQGGKAEPLRVQFQRGRSSAMIAGKLRGKDEYQRLFDACQIRPEWLQEVESLIKNITQNRNRYQAVGDPLGIRLWGAAEQPTHLRNSHYIIGRVAG